jgi:hypothetical protein
MVEIEIISLLLMKDVINVESKNIIKTILQNKKITEKKRIFTENENISLDAREVT